MDPVCIKLLVLTLFKFSSKRKHFGNKKYWKTFTFMENKAHLTMKANNLQGKRKEISAWTRLCMYMCAYMHMYICMSFRGESNSIFFSKNNSLHCLENKYVKFCSFFLKKNFLSFRRWNERRPFMPLWRERNFKLPSSRNV
jgi:hypothetical protein